MQSLHRCTDALALIPRPGSSARTSNNYFWSHLSTVGCLSWTPCIDLSNSFASLLTSANDFWAELLWFGLRICSPPPVTVLWSSYTHVQSPTSIFDLVFVAASMSLLATSFFAFSIRSSSQRVSSCKPAFVGLALVE